MNTDNYRAWQELLNQRDQAIYLLFGLAAILVIAYLITYAEKWVPPKIGKLIRLAYEIGGLALYVGIVAVCAKG